MNKKRFKFTETMFVFHNYFNTLCSPKPLKSTSKIVVDLFGKTDLV